jgi:predicted metalloprotease with PDZ domain
LINNNTLFGYLEGYDTLAVKIDFQKPAKFYASTSLKKSVESAESVSFEAQDYHQLVDNPILFSEPDTAHIVLGQTTVLVACYAAKEKKLATQIAQYIQPLLTKQKAYLGGRLPVDNYTFIVYLQVSDNPYSSFGDGLEHAQSTVILSNMPLNKEMISRNVYGIASHEFFHTVMPLALHSKEIEYYNFNKPVMSQHLWLYEGMTEYFTIHLPISQNTQSIKEFVSVLKEKFMQSKKFDQNLSLTEASKSCIERQDQYMNFYAKGPLVCLCLDITLRIETDGKYGLQNLVNDLLKKYGVHKPFNDNELFEEIVKITNSPEIKRMIDSYILGTEEIHLQEYLLRAGLDLDSETGVIASPSELQLKLRKDWIGQ